MISAALSALYVAFRPLTLRLLSRRLLRCGEASGPRAALGPWPAQILSSSSIGVGRPLAPALAIVSGAVVTITASVCSRRPRCGGSSGISDTRDGAALGLLVVATVRLQVRSAAWRRGGARA